MIIKKTSEMSISGVLYSLFLTLMGVELIFQAVLPTILSVNKRVPLLFSTVKYSF